MLQKSYISVSILISKSKKLQILGEDPWFSLGKELESLKSFAQLHFVVILVTLTYPLSFMF